MVVSIPLQEPTQIIHRADRDKFDVTVEGYRFEPLSDSHSKLISNGFGDDDLELRRYRNSTHHMLWAFVVAK